MNTKKLAGLMLCCLLVTSQFQCRSSGPLPLKIVACVSTAYTAIVHPALNQAAPAFFGNQPLWLQIVCPTVSSAATVAGFVPGMAAVIAPQICLTTSIVSFLISLGYDVWHWHAGAAAPVGVLALPAAVVGGAGGGGGGVAPAVAGGGGGGGVAPAAAVAGGGGGVAPAAAVAGGGGVAPAAAVVGGAGAGAGGADADADADAVDAPA